MTSEMKKETSTSFDFFCCREKNNNTHENEMSSLPKTADEVLAKLKKENKRYIQFHFMNIAGELRGMEEAADLIPKIAKNGISSQPSPLFPLEKQATHTPNHRHHHHKTKNVRATCEQSMVLRSELLT